MLILKSNLSHSYTCSTNKISSSNIIHVYLIFWHLKSLGWCFLNELFSVWMGWKKKKQKGRQRGLTGLVKVIYILMSHILMRWGTHLKYHSKLVRGLDYFMDAKIILSVWIPKIIILDKFYCMRKKDSPSNAISRIKFVCNLCCIGHFFNSCGRKLFIIKKATKI